MWSRVETMRNRTIVPILLICCALWGVPTAAGARDGYAAGYLTATLPNPGAEPIGCAVWYPATAGTTRAVYDFGRLSRPGSAFTDGRPDTAGGPYPLIVYSHGYSGCAVSSAYLCEALAAAGFVVAAPDHTDDLKACSLSPEFRRPSFILLRLLSSAIKLGNHLASGTYDVEDFRYRFVQIRDAIDYCTAARRDPRSALFGLVDAERVGAVGHSLGAFSVMVAAGARDVGIDFPIDAVVSMSGPGGDVFTCEQMKRITVPAMLMYGTEEAGKRGKGEGITEQYRCLAGPKYLMGLVGGGHLVFAEGYLAESSTWSRLKLEADARHDLISRFVVAFFSLYLADDDRARSILERGDPGWDPYDSSP
jgi:predicted dienelactone hydrolase